MHIVHLGFGIFYLVFNHVIFVKQVLPYQNVETRPYLIALMFIECAIALSTLGITFWNKIPRFMFYMLIIFEGIAFALCIVLNGPKSECHWIQEPLMFVYFFHMLICVSELVYHEETGEQSDRQYSQQQLCDRTKV